MSVMRLTSPNPRVGAVIATVDGVVLSIGATQRHGGMHAEAVALRNAEQGDINVRGSTLYVTLEPCAHHGRTPPCCDAVIAAGIAHVVCALPDPNPLVAGEGFRRLRAAGISVSIGDGADAAWEMNLGFFSRMQRARPWVRLKVAASLDGSTALANGQSQWITSDAARIDGHAWRARACAVLTGVGTILADDPRLDVRLVDTPRQPIRIIVDSDLRTPPTASVFKQNASPVWIYTLNPDPMLANALAAVGAHITVLNADAATPKLNLAAVMTDLAKREINELHVEAGFKLNGSLIDAGLVDELLLYQAPTLLGPGMGLANLAAKTSLDQALSLSFHSVAPIGGDLRIIARTQPSFADRQVNGAH